VKKGVVILILFCSACSAPTLDPYAQRAIGEAGIASTRLAADAQATAQPATQSYLDQQYAQSLTATFAPLAAVATSNANEATSIANVLSAQHATSEALNNQSAITATQQALAVLESEVQKTIAQNNAAISNSTNWVIAFRGVMWGGALIIMGFVFVLACFALYHLAMWMGAKRNIAEINARWSAVFENENKARKFRLDSPTSTAVTLAERHVAKYSHYDALDRWRATALGYVQSAVECNKNYGDYAFSEPTAIKHSLVLHPDTGKVWREGYRRTIGWLVDCKVMSKTGTGGKTDWANGWTYERFENEFYRTPLPPPPDGPIPRPKILGRGYEVVEAVSIS